MKLTPWIDGSVKPKRRGVYERRITKTSIGFSKWDGSNWMWANEYMEEAADESVRSPGQSLPWRGLAQDPKVKT